MVDGKAEELDISIAGRDFTIKQSPGVLQSNREGGTTGAAVWRAAVHVAGWFGSARNPLFETGVLNSHSVVLELGTGISGLIPLVLGPKVGRVIATDQQYSLRPLRENIEANKPVRRSGPHSITSNVDVLPLDWETDDISSFLRMYDLDMGVDAMIICDCIFNYALIPPLVQTCTDICNFREEQFREQGCRPLQPSLCIVAQQLRQPDVFEEWLREFLKAFKVWRVPDTMLSEELKQGSAFVVHVGMLR